MTPAELDSFLEMDEDELAEATNGYTWDVVERIFTAWEAAQEYERDAWVENDVTWTEFDDELLWWNAAETLWKRFVEESTAAPACLVPVPMRISYFDGARDTIPKAQELTWEQFTAWLGPHGYRAGGRDAAEDKRIKEALPSFSPAEYRDGTTRANKNVLRVWMLVLDVDHVDEPTAHGIRQRVVELGFAAVIYSSWRHGRDPWRFRVVVPLDKPVDGSEWEGFWSRAITLFGGICDPACSDPARLYFGPFAPIGTEHLNFYWVCKGGPLWTEAVWKLPVPAGARVVTTPSDENVETVVQLLAPCWPSERRHEAHLALAGGLLSAGFSDADAVEILCGIARAQDPDNEDRPKRLSIVEHTRQQLEAQKLDPKIEITSWGTLVTLLDSSGGAVGYIIDTIKELLNPPELKKDLLKRAARDWVKATSSDTMFALGDELSLIHAEKKFNLEYLEKLINALVDRFPNYKAKSIADHFEKSFETMRTASPPIACPTNTQLTERIGRAQRLRRQRQRDLHARQQAQESEPRLDLIEGGNGPKVGLANTMTVLTTHENWKDVLAFDEFANNVIKTAPPPVREGDVKDGIPALGDWDEQDSARSIAWIASNVGFEPTQIQFETALLAVARKRSFHPVREYLQGLRSDGVARLDTMLATYFGADDTPYTRFVGAKWMISAVARIMQPGAKVDHVLVLEALQGYQKSSTIRALVPNPAWYSDSEIQLGNKDAYIVLQRKWIFEVGELDSFKGKEQTAIKRFITSQVDNYRPPYGRTNRDFPRQVVFVPTTNEEHYLPDRENRRYWPVKCKRRANAEALAAARDQLWAEALFRYLNGEKWWPDTPELEVLCRNEQSEREIGDDWQPLIEAFLWSLPDDATVTSENIQKRALELKPREMSRYTATRVGIVMSDLRWTRKGRKRVYIPPPDWPKVENDAPVLANIIGFGGVVELPQAIASATGQTWSGERTQRAINYLISTGVVLADGRCAKLQPKKAANEPWKMALVPSNGASASNPMFTTVVS